MYSSNLQHELRQFTGTEVWYRHALNKRMLYTEGVQYFAEQAGCYWFLDIVATEFFQLQASQPFMLISLESANGKAVITVDDGNGTAITTKNIDLTDCPEGQWNFYLTDDVLLLPSEY